MSTPTGMPSLDRIPNGKPLIGSVLERTPTRSVPESQRFNFGTGSTGFPAVKRRAQLDGDRIVRGQSAFMRSRVDPKKATEVPIVTSASHSALENSDWRQAISQENETRVHAMTEEEREQEKREIVERFGDNIGELLKKAREARLKKSSQNKLDLDEGMITAFYSSILKINGLL